MHSAVVYHVATTATHYSSVCHLQEGYWAHDVSFGSVDGTLEYYRCPPGYCRCSSNNVCNSIYHYDNNDLQCVCDRQGMYVAIYVHMCAHTWKVHKYYITIYLYIHI